MDTLKLFTVEEIRNLLVKWWCLYKTIDTDINTNDKFMVLAYKRTFEMMGLAKLVGENPIDFFVEKVKSGYGSNMLDRVYAMIKEKYPREEDFIKATASMALHLHSLPFDSKPLFGRSSR